MKNRSSILSTYHISAHIIEKQMVLPIKASQIILLVFFFSSSIGFTQTGMLDPTFGTNGIVKTKFGTHNTFSTGLCVMPDGKLLALSRIYQTSMDIGLAQYNPDGSLDSTFGNEGTLMIDLNNGSVDNPTHLELLSTGKILINGVSNDDLFLLRLNLDGSIDQDFGTNGYVLVDVITGTADDAGSFILRPTGEIVMISQAYEGPGGGTGNVIQFTENGALDHSFGTNGIFMINNIENSLEQLFDIALNPSGDAFVVARVYQLNGSDNTYVYRVKPNGTYNTDFHGIGYRLLPIGTDEDTAHNIAVLPNGQVIVAGYTKVIDDNPFLAKLHADGNFDLTFGSNGIKILSNIYSTKINDIIIEANEKIVLAGSAYINFIENILIARLNADGSFDNSFGNNGYTTTSTGPSQGNEAGVSLARDASGSYLMTAVSGEPISGNVKQVLLKYQNLIMGIEEFNHPKIQLFPNPTNGTVWIKNTAQQVNTSVFIQDISGKKLATVRINSDHSIEIPATLNSGVYFVASQDQLQIKPQKIILVR